MSRKAGKALLLSAALCAPGVLSFCPCAEAADLINASVQGIAGSFNKWGDEDIPNSGSGLAYAALNHTPSADERPQFARKAPDADKPAVAGKASFTQSRPEVKVSLDDKRSISFGMAAAKTASGRKFSIKSAKGGFATGNGGNFKPDEGDEIKYSEVEEGVDLYYQARGNRLEEDIVLRKPPKKNTFSFNLNTQGLAAMPQADGTIHFKDERTGQLLFYFEKPFMVDSAGNKSEDVHLKLRNTKELIVEANSDWLNDTVRLYPIIIDPTLVLVQISTQNMWGGIPHLVRLYPGNSGNLHSIFNAYVNGVSGLGYSESQNDGITWTDAIITTPTTTGKRHAFAVDTANTLHLVWGNVNFISYRNNPGGGWGMIEPISADTTFFQTQYHAGWPDWTVDLYADSVKNLHLIWTSSNNGGTVYYSKKTFGATWSVPIALNDPFATPLHGAAAVLDDNDKIHVVAWYDDTTSGKAVYITNVSESWASPEIIYSSYCAFGSIAVDSGNKPHIALHSTVGKTFYTNKTQGTWGEPMLLHCRLGGIQPIIGIDINNSVNILCARTGSIGVPDTPAQQLYQANNTSGVWSPCVPTPFNRVVGSMGALFDKALNAWHMAIRHGGETSYGVPGPISYYRLDDLVPPALIRDLKAAPGISSGTIALTWTAPGDDGMSGAASRYDAKVATYPIINQDDYDLLPVYSSWTTPRPAYSPESQVLAGLTGGVTYYIAVLSFDDQNNASYVTSSTNIVAGTVTPLALSSWSVSAVAASADTYILPPGGLTGAVLPDLSVKLEWSPSPSTTTVASYSVYWDSGAGVMDYITPLSSVVSPATSYTTIALSTGIYRFGVRSLAGNGIEEANTGVVITVNVDTAAVVVPVRAEIKVPQSGKRIAGNRVTVMAELTIGSPALVRDVLFQYRAAGSSVTAWSPIPAAGYNHPNPDASAPYFIHWDLSGLPDWDYELRAVATSVYGRADPAPPSIFVTIDPVNPQLEEKTVGASQQKRAEVYNTVANTVQVGAESGAVVSVALPAGALTETSATLKAVSNPPAVPPAESALLTAGQNFELTLESGQTQLNAPAALALYYPDADNNGYLDGTELRADKLGMYYYDTTGAKWTRLAGSAVNGGAKTITAQTTHFSLFGLFAPAASDLSAVLVYPVPYVPNDGSPDNGRPYSATDPDSGILFDNLTQAVKIELFTLSGELVWKKVTDSSGGKLRWDAKNSSGREVASGGYFAVITDSAAGSRVVRKLAIIR